MQLAAFLAFLGLIVQNAASSLVTKATRSKGEQSDAYAPTAVICTTETVKLVVSVVLEIKHRKANSKAGKSSALAIARDLLVTRRRETIKLAFPALLYSLVNLCTYVGISSLDLPSYVILWQLKIFAAALFGRFLYARHISYQKSFALIILVLGVILAQVDLSGLAPTTASSDYIKGVLAIILGSLASGLAGSFLENAYKNNKGTSINFRNIQICLSSLVFSLISLSFRNQDLSSIQARGFFHGFTPTVFFQVMLHASGGLLVSYLVANVGTLWKGFSSSLAIAVTNLLSTYFFEDAPIVPPTQLWLGTFLVISSTVLFANG